MNLGVYSTLHVTIVVVLFQRMQQKQACIDQDPRTAGSILVVCMIAQLYDRAIIDKYDHLLT